MLKFMFGVPYKSRYLDEVVTGKEEGGGGGGGGGPTEAEKAAAAQKVADDAKVQAQADKDAELERLRGENAKLTKFRAASAEHVEYDEETGEVRVKEKPKYKAPTQEELDRAQLSGEVTDQAVQIMEMNRLAEQVTINKYKAKDPLFAQVLQKAREKVNGVPPAQRTEKLWDRAYSLARGEMNEDYAKYHEEQGRRKAIDEMGRSGGAALPSGGSSGKGADADGKIDYTKVVLSREQLAAANKMIDQGLLENLDQYKDNAVRLGLAEVMS